MKLSFDMTFDCPDSIKPHLEKTIAGEYDVPLMFLPEAPRILDLGANCGAFSIWASHRWPGAEVFAFEPHPKTFEILSGNVKPYPNVKVHAWGIGTPGMRILYDGMQNCGEMSFHRLTSNKRLTGQHFEVHDPLTLPDQVDIIKLDIEGCEMEVLGPLIRSGRRFSAILVEYHSEGLRREIDALLKDYALYACVVEHSVGRGVCRYIHNSIHQEIIRAFTY